MTRATILAAALAAAATPAWAQAPAEQPSPPPPPPPYQGQPVQQPPQAQPAPAPAPAPTGQAGTGSAAQPGTGASGSSQQVVVNPPQSQPGSTTVVNPPPAQQQQQPIVISGDRLREPRNPLATVALDAGYGGLAGLLVGVGWALIEGDDEWGRSLAVGAGVGIIVGAGVGIVQAVSEQRKYDEDRRRAGLSTLPPRPDRVARDGLGTLARDPVVRRAPGIVVSGRF